MPLAPGIRFCEDNCTGGADGTAGSEGEERMGDSGGVGGVCISGNWGATESTAISDIADATVATGTPEFTSGITGALWGVEDDPDCALTGIWAGMSIFV